MNLRTTVHPNQLLKENDDKKSESLQGRMKYNRLSRKAPLLELKLANNNPVLYQRQPQAGDLAQVLYPGPLVPLPRVPFCEKITVSDN